MVTIQTGQTYMSMSWDQVLEFFFTSSHLSGTVATDYSLFFTIAVDCQKMESSTASGGRLPILPLPLMVMVYGDGNGNDYQRMESSTARGGSPPAARFSQNFRYNFSKRSHTWYYVLNFSWLFERGYQVVKVGSLEVFEERLLAGRCLAQHQSGRRHQAWAQIILFKESLSFLQWHSKLKKG